MRDGAGGGQGPALQIQRTCPTPAKIDHEWFTLAARLHPRFRPGQARGRRLAVATRLGPGLAGDDGTVDLDLSGPRREERAEDTERAVVEAGRRVEHERLDAI